MRRAASLLAGSVLLLGAACQLLDVDGPGGGRERGAVSLSTWRMTGCWEVRLTSWAATPGTSARSGESASGRSAGTEPGGRTGSPGTSGPSALPDAVDPPVRVMLLADSVDLWGRVLDSYRAVPVGEGSPDRAPVGDAARRARSLRWMTAGDTLWLLWSQGRTRGGVALSRREGRFRGSARATAAPTDVSAGAEAWPVNCATGERETPAPWRRR